MLKGISKSTTGKVHRSAVMLTIFILAALLLALSSGCSDRNNASPVLTESRASLLEEIESLLPHWDRKHLTASLDITMAECTQADLENARLLLSCHQEKDVLLHCGEEVDLNQCYAEVSEECHAVGTVSQACTEAYEVFLADDSPAAQKIMEDTIDECPGARLGAQLSQAAYKTDVAASLPLGYALHNTYTGISSAGGFAYIATSNTAGGTACQVVFKGTDSLVDVKKDLASALAEACEPEPGLNLGQCGSGFLEQYRSLRDQGLVADVQAMVGGGECSGGLCPSTATAWALRWPPCSPRNSGPLMPLFTARASLSRSPLASRARLSRRMRIATRPLSTRTAGPTGAIPCQACLPLFWTSSTSAAPLRSIGSITRSALSSSMKSPRIFHPMACSPSVTKSAATSNAWRRAVHKYCGWALPAAMILLSAFFLIPEPLTGSAIAVRAACWKA